MRYEVRYNSKTRQYEVVDQIIGREIIAAYVSNADARLKAVETNEAWEKHTSRLQSFA